MCYLREECKRRKHGKKIIFAFKIWWLWYEWSMFRKSVKFHLWLFWILQSIFPHINKIKNSEHNQLCTINHCKVISINAEKILKSKNWMNFYVHPINHWLITCVCNAIWSSVYPGGLQLFCGNLALEITHFR